MYIPFFDGKSWYPKQLPLLLKCSEEADWYCSRKVFNFEYIIALGLILLDFFSPSQPVTLIYSSQSCSPVAGSVVSAICKISRTVAQC